MDATWPMMLTWDGVEETDGLAGERRLNAVSERFLRVNCRLCEALSVSSGGSLISDYYKCTNRSIKNVSV